MKIKKSILNYLIFTLFLILSSQAANLKSSDKKHPNVGEITSEYQKMVKPFYQKEYFPKEVSSINEPKPAYDFTKAQIVGAQETNKELDQKPTIYETVVQRRGTSVIHPVPKPGSFASNSAGALFSDNPVKEYPVQKISPGTYSIPVKLETSSKLLNQPNFAGYDSVQYKGSSDNNSDAFDDNISMAEIDINQIASRVKGAKSSKDKIKILNKGMRNLEKDASNISKQIQKEVATLLNAKGIAINMNSVLAKYEAKVKKSQMSRLKLSDVITIKKKLITKLEKEIQGFRTASSDYSELRKVNPHDIKRIIRSVKKELGH